MESWLFLLLIALIAFVAKKSKFINCVSCCACFKKLLPNSAKIMSWLSDKGINLGVTIISITILVPIVTGQIGLKDLIQSFKNTDGMAGDIFVEFWWLFYPQKE